MSIDLLKDSWGGMRGWSKCRAFRVFFGGFWCDFFGSTFLKEGGLQCIIVLRVGKDIHQAFGFLKVNGRGKSCVVSMFGDRIGEGRYGALWGLWLILGRWTGKVDVSGVSDMRRRRSIGSFHTIKLKYI